MDLLKRSLQQGNLFFFMAPSSSEPSYRNVVPNGAKRVSREPVLSSEVVTAFPPETGYRKMDMP